MHRILLLGTGLISSQHMAEFGMVPECRIVACADSLPGRAADFALRNGLERSFDSLEEALAWGKFDAAINATPDLAHKPTTLRLLAAGKHVLCEKPLAPNFEDAAEMADAAESAGLVNVVNFTYRNSPAVWKARELILAGELGQLRHVEASYRQSWLVSRAWGDWRTEDKWLWRLSRSHGSTGVLGDVGVHILDFACYAAAEPIVALQAHLVAFRKAQGDRIGQYGLDANDSVLIAARLAGGALASISATRYATGHINDLSLTLHGQTGALKVETDGKTSNLSACLGEDVHDAVWRPVPFDATPRNARRFVDALSSGKNGDPSFRRGADIQRVIDAAFASHESGRMIDCA